MGRWWGGGKQIGAGGEVAIRVLFVERRIGESRWRWLVSVLGEEWALRFGFWVVGRRFSLRGRAEVGARNESMVYGRTV